jgi:hypothetical protein
VRAVCSRRHRTCELETGTAKGACVIHDDVVEREKDPRKRRRSRRIRARIRVVVRVQSRNKETVCEETDALVVNAHGGLVLLATSVARDQFVTVINAKTNQELLARVTGTGQRFMGKAQVGIEFIRPAPDFWGIFPQPKDWKAASSLPAPDAIPEKV